MPDTKPLYKLVCGISLGRVLELRGRDSSIDVERTKQSDKMTESEPIFRRNLTRVAKANKDREFSVASYNILCDKVFDKNPLLYSYLPKEIKCRGPIPKDSARHTQLLKEVRLYR